jgi:hypothetical protein
MFDIIKSRDLLAKAEAEYADFKLNPDSSRHGLNCIITIYHLHEWVWGDWLKRDDVTKGKLGVNDLRGFKSWLDQNWLGFGTVQDLTNGAKHFRKPEMEKTDKIAGYGMGPYGVGPYGASYLLIDYGPHAVQRWQTAEQLLDEAIIFWRGFFDNHHSMLP